MLMAAVLGSAQQQPNIKIITMKEDKIQMSLYLFKCLVTYMYIGNDRSMPN